MESAFSGITESGGRFCVCVFDRNLVSVAVEMFSQTFGSSGDAVEIFSHLFYLTS